MNECSCWSTFSSAFGIVSVVDFGYTERCAMVSRFNHDSLMACDVKHLFIYLLAFLLFGEVSVQVFGSFLNQVVHFFWLCFKGSLYILGNSLLSDTCLLQYFFPVRDLFSHSFDTVFHWAEVFHCNEVQLINHFFHESCLVLYLKRHHHTQGHLGFILLFSRSFIVSHFTFKSVIHFE